MLLPPIDRRREMDKNLVAFFRDHRLIDFRRAIADFCRYYHLRRPRIGWYEYIDWGKTAGKTFEDGRIHLVHPENWKRGRVYYRERMWIQMIYHEMGHFIFWSDPERKAEIFSRRMVAGLRVPNRRSATRSRTRAGSSNVRRAASRLRKRRGRIASARKTGRAARIGARKS